VIAVLASQPDAQLRLEGTVSELLSRLEHHSASEDEFIWLVRTDGRQVAVRVSAILMLHDADPSTFDRVRAGEGAFTATLQLDANTHLRVFDPLQALDTKLSGALAGATWPAAFVEVQCSAPVGPVWVNAVHVETVQPSSRGASDAET
jgi:hypothetical protein